MMILSFAAALALAALSSLLLRRGVPADYFVRNRLFRPFRTTKDGGLGIGLYQCSQNIESHGGEIDVTSEVGKGSTFTVYLPADSP